MDYCYDTEFLDDGERIDLISIGIVCEDGRQYYAVNADCDFERVCRDDWLWENVVPHLPTNKTNWDNLQLGRLVTWLDKKVACVKPKWVIANEVRDFIFDDGRWCLEDGEPRLWAYYSAYDHVALCQLFGRMIDLPALMPKWTHDLMQLIEPIEGFKKPVQGGDEHNALADARWNWKLLCAARDALASPVEPPF